MGRERLWITSRCLAARCHSVWRGSPTVDTAESLTPSEPDFTHLQDGDPNVRPSSFGDAPNVPLALL